MLDRISFNHLLGLWKNQEEIYLQTGYKVKSGLADLKFWMEVTVCGTMKPNV